MRTLTEAQLRHLPKHSDKYRRLTAECYRADMHAISRASADILKPIHTWIAEKLQNNGNGIVQTRHSVEERLKTYVNQRSRSGTYIELFPSEFELLRNVNNWFRKQQHYHLVELGFNSQFELCKIGIVCPIITSSRAAYVSVFD